MHATAFIWQSSLRVEQILTEQMSKTIFGNCCYSPPPPPPCKKESGSVDLNSIWWSSLIFKQVSFFLHRCTFCIITLCVFEASLAPFWKKAGFLCRSPIAHPLAHVPYGFPQSSRNRQSSRDLFSCAILHCACQRARDLCHYLCNTLKRMAVCLCTLHNF